MSPICINCLKSLGYTLPFRSHSTLDSMNQFKRQMLVNSIVQAESQLPLIYQSNQRETACEILLFQGQLTLAFFSLAPQILLYCSLQKSYLPQQEMEGLNRPRLLLSTCWIELCLLPSSFCSKTIRQYLRANGARSQKKNSLNGQYFSLFYLF